MSEFQSVEDFEREYAHLIKDQEDAEARKNAPPQKQAKKNKRQEVDAETRKIEREATEEIGLTNWAGRLLEYRNAHPVAEGLQFSEQIVDHLVNMRYTAMVLIAESPIQFGIDVSFSNKKAAKQYASKKAIDWLIEHKHMPPGGAVKWPKTTQAPPQKAAAPPNPDSPPPFNPIATSYASQVPNLCTLLGYNIPRYVLEPIAPGVPVYDCWADFGGEPEIDGKVGEFKSIHGKKAAKEMVAKEVLSFLKSIERQRRGGSEDEGSKRKRSFGAPSSSPEIPGKVLKV